MTEDSGQRTVIRGNKGACPLETADVSRVQVKKKEVEKIRS
jgi:hypothetical protein